MQLATMQGKACCDAMNIPLLYYSLMIKVFLHFKLVKHIEAVP